MMFVTLALSAAIDASPSPEPATASPAPVRIFERGFARLESYPLPPYAVFIDTWLIKQTDTRLGSQSGSIIVRTRYAVRTSDGGENYTAFPVQGSALPPARVLTQFLGPFAFALLSNRPPRKDLASLQPDIPSPLKLIANVVAHPKPDYEIENAGIEAVDGHDTYHLRLSPLSDGRKHNLHDLWIDVVTFDLWKAHFTSRYAPDPMLPDSPTDVVVWFKPIASYWVLSRAIWSWDYFTAGKLSDYDASTDRIAFPSELPDWLFDQREYDQHVRARAPDVLGPLFSAIPGATPTP